MRNDVGPGHAIGNRRRLTAMLLPLLFLATGYATLTGAQEEDFAAWVAAFRQEARTEGIGSDTLDAVLPGPDVPAPCRRARPPAARREP